MTNRIIFSLDIGDSKVVSLAGSIGEQVEVLGLSSYYFTNNRKINDCQSVKNGAICDLEATGLRVTQVLNEARINADCSIGGVISGVAGSQVVSRYSKYAAELNSQSVTADMIEQLINQARYINLPQNYEVLDYEVQEYLLDKENYTTNPIHLTANTIESNLNIFLGGASQISNLKKVIRYSGFSLSKLVPSGILAGMAVLNNEEKELGCCLIDIGSGTTDVVVYENGFIRYTCSLPFGGENVTRDIAGVLKISRNLAEDIKLNYGGCAYSNSQHKFGEGIAITDHRGVNTNISRKLVIDIITERLKEIFEVVKTGLDKQKIYDIISSGIVVTGGSSVLPGLEAFAAQCFNLPVRIGIPNYNGGFAEIVATPKYATSLGALYFAQEYMLNDTGMVQHSSVDFKKIMRKFKGLFSR